MGLACRVDGLGFRVQFRVSEGFALRACKALSSSSA